jgi:hypothetical protein
MKKLTIILLVLLTSPIFGQTQLITSQNKSVFYIYNNSKDTLFLTKIDVGEIGSESNKISDSIQIDGLGSKEIVFERNCTGLTRDIKEASQTFEKTEIHKYEIWNIDTKTLIFEAVDVYKFSYDNWRLPNIFPDSLKGFNKGICSRKYEFSIDNKGLIRISNLKYENVANNCIADKKEGIYKFINGKYSYETNNLDTMKIIGVNDSTGMQLVKHYNAKNEYTIFAKYYLCWNNNQDSILISIPYCFESGYPHYDTPYLPSKGIDTCNIFLKQLDKQGLFEVIIKHYKNNATITTIISLDSRKILFNAANSNFVHYSLGTNFGDERNNNSYCSYSYEIAFDEDNNLIIHKLEQQGGLYPRGPINRKKGSGKNDYFHTCCQPDKKEGIYVLENGIYTYSESKSKEQKINNKLNTNEK